MSGPDGGSGGGRPDRGPESPRTFDDHLRSHEKGAADRRARLERQIDTHDRIGEDLGAYQPRLDKQDIARVSEPPIRKATQKLPRAERLAARILTSSEVVSKPFEGEDGRLYEYAEGYVRSGSAKSFWLLRHSFALTRDVETQEERVSHQLTTLHLGRLNYSTGKLSDGRRIKGQFTWEKKSSFKTLQEIQARGERFHAGKELDRRQEEMGTKKEERSAAKEARQDARQELRDAKGLLAEARAARASEERQQQLQRNVEVARTELGNARNHHWDTRMVLIDQDHNVREARLAFGKAKRADLRARRKGNQDRRRARREPIIRSLRGD